MAINDRLASSYNLFKDQKNKFVHAISSRYPDTQFLLNWKDVKIDYPGNWFIMFSPGSWGCFKKGFSGVHYGFVWFRDRKNNKEYVRLTVGVERPLKEEYKKSFKIDVVEVLTQRKITLPSFDLWPNAGIMRGAKLIETRSFLDESTGQELLQKYSSLGQFNEVTAEVIKQYNNRGCFTERLQFPT